MNTCPNCGDELRFVTNAPEDWAPWVSDRCGRAWWPAELSDDARQLWDPNTGAYQPSEALDWVAADVEEARERVREGKKAHDRRVNKKVKWRS